MPWATRPQKNNLHFTILLVENSPKRQHWIETHSPENVRFHTVASGQIAIGVVAHMQPDDYAGIMLDCDLDEGLEGGPQDYFDGVEIAKLVVQHAPRHLPVIVHSHNPAGAARMVTMLTSNGFDVLRVPFRDLEEEQLREWLMEIEEDLGSG